MDIPDVFLSHIRSSHTLRERYGTWYFMPIVDGSQIVHGRELPDDCLFHIQTSHTWREQQDITFAVVVFQIILDRAIPYILLFHMSPPFTRLMYWLIRYWWRVQLLGALGQSDIGFAAANEGQYTREVAVRELMEGFQNGMQADLAKFSSVLLTILMVRHKTVMELSQFRLKPLI